jgi:hypothetical protein
LVIGKDGCRPKSVSIPSIREPGHPGIASPFAGTIGTVEKREVEKRSLVGQPETGDLSIFNTQVRTQPHRRPAFRIGRQAVGQKLSHLDMLKVFRDTVFCDALESLFRKVKTMLLPGSTRYLDQVEQTLHVGIKPYKDYGRFKEILYLAQDAAVNRKTIEMV